MVQFDMFLGKKRSAARAPRHGRDFWERHAQHDPLWAILSDPSKKGRKWDLPEFFETGAREISIVLYRLAEFDVAVDRGSALDFGCGVGRLTQALAGHFSQAVGVDISPTMIQLAEKLNRHPDRVRYVSNAREDLSIFDNDAFDFVYSDIVLQHVEPTATRRYLAEFLRVLKKGGVLVFQLPSHPRPVGEQGTAARPMPEDAYRARLTVRTIPESAIGSSTDLMAFGSVTNLSARSWSQPECGSIRLGNHWFDARGETMLVQNDGRISLPPTLGPGETFDFALKMKAPAIAGEYRCEIDLVHEAVAWFVDRGSSSVRFVVRVEAPSGGQGRVAEEPHRENYAPPAVQDGGIYDDLPPETEDPGGIPMYSIHRDEIVALISSHGAQLLRLEEDGKCGREWVGYRYFVRR